MDSDIISEIIFLDFKDLSWEAISEMGITIFADR